MKKIRLIALLLCAVLLCPVLSSCRKDVKEPNGHNMGSWTVQKEPTFKKKGTLTRSCTDEGCSYTQKYKVKAAKGLEYIENDDGQLYISGRGSFKGSFLYIPTENEQGKPIFGIAEQAFLEDSKLQYVYIAEGLSHIEGYAFTGCPKLLGAHLPESCIEMNVGVFLSCPVLKRANIPAKITRLSDQLFDGCTALEEVRFSEGLTDIGFSVFNLCTSLKTITFPSTLETLGTDAFCDCTGLTEIVFSTGLKEIGRNAFINCDALTQVVLPESLQTLSECSFAYCDRLRTVYIPESVMSIGASNGFSPFVYCNKELTLLTNAKERPVGWAEDFNCYYLSMPENSTDPQDGYSYLKVVYGAQKPAN